MDMEEVDDGGEGGLLGSTVGTACGEEDCEEGSSLDGASCAHLNFSKSDQWSSICDNRSAIVSSGGDWEGEGWSGWG